MHGNTKNGYKNVNQNWKQSYSIQKYGHCKLYTLSCVHYSRNTQAMKWNTRIEAGIIESVKNPINECFKYTENMNLTLKNEEYQNFNCTYQIIFN